MPPCKWLSSLMNDMDLMESEVVVTGRLVDASNATLYGHLKNNKDLKVIYKPIAGERPLWDFTSGNLASREVAAHKFSEIFDFNLVPPTVMRDGPYGKGMVQLWRSNSQPSNLIEIGQSDHPDLRKITLFDCLINNADRKYGHLLILDDGRIQGCDHGVCFHIEDKLRSVLWQFAGESFTESEMEILRRVISHDLKDDFHSLLQDDEINAIRERAIRLLNEPFFPLPATDRPSIPWPPV
jgi:hypothetical protein